MKIDDILIYKDTQASLRYGTGVVTSITPEDYTVLWSGRGVAKYKRSILDGKLEEIFERVDKSASLPKERHLLLGPSKIRVAFNENYDREKLASLCEKLKLSNAHKAAEVADGLAAELFTKKSALRGTAKAVLCQLAELCSTRTSAGYDEARNISRELFFGYVLQKSDFEKLDRFKVRRGSR